jgi:hypothetical protein
MGGQREKITVYHFYGNKDYGHSSLKTEATATQLTETGPGK